MHYRLGIGLALFICFADAAKAAPPMHDSGWTPRRVEIAPAPRERVAPGPCDSLEEDAKRVVGDVAEREIGRLLVSTAVFGDQFEAELRANAKLVDAARAKTSLPAASSASGDVLIPFGIMLGVSVFGEKPQAGTLMYPLYRQIGEAGFGHLAFASIMSGSVSLMSVLGQSSGPNPLDQANGDIVTGPSMKTVRKQIDEGADRLGAGLAQTFRWTPAQREKFRAKLGERIAAAIRDGKTAKDVAAALEKITPLDMVAELQLAPQSQVAAVKKLDEFVQSASKLPGNGLALTDAEKEARITDIPEQHRMMARGRKTLENILEGLESPAARAECSRVIREFADAESRLRKLCEANAR